MKLLSLVFPTRYIPVARILSGTNEFKDRNKIERYR